MTPHRRSHALLWLLLALITALTALTAPARADDSDSPEPVPMRPPETTKG